MQNRPLPTQGSSPRMRGTRRAGACGSDRPGIIPAYAGNTGRNVGNHELPRDHPRVCGEHVSRAWRIILLRGSSPRMRGTHGGEQLALVVFGIIPAYAGNTHVRHWRCRWQGDHPRVCGEHRVVPPQSSTSNGSSPRMRGTRVQQFASTLQHGIIPAYAGNTRYPPYCPQAVPDHPRVCGEHPRAPIMKFHGAGSSPRMRGTPTCADYEIPWRGIIPAYAGNTQDSGILRRFSRDHPRVCGEHLWLSQCAALRAGSSPRMRGTLNQLYISAQRKWIIPAYAGNTPFSKSVNSK